MFDNVFARRGLSLDRLKTLLEVEAAGSISAAGREATRQSQYSRQLKELAEYFGVDLTERRGKKVKLTIAGRRISSLARQFLAGLENFDNEARQAPVSIKIGAGDSVIQWLVIPRLGRRPTFKKFKFEVTSLQTRETAEHLADGRIDFGILRENARPAGARFLFLGELSYSIFVPRGLLEGNNSPTSSEAMLRYPMAVQVTDGQFTEHVRRMTEGVGMRFSPALACQSLPQAAAAVRSGSYAAVLPTIASAELKPGSFVEVNDRALHGLKRRIGLVWNPRIASVRPEIAAFSKELGLTLQFESKL